MRYNALILLSQIIRTIKNNSACSVNLRKIAVSFPDGSAKIDSRYKRCKRFFASVEFNFNQLARWVFKLFYMGKKYYLTVDRTNWRWGKGKINILTLGMTHEGTAIPLLWNLLNKAGNATAEEHQHIIERFIQLFDQTQIAGVLAEREFASGALFQWLNKSHIPFYIRIKEGSLLKIKGKKLYSAAKFFSGLNPKEQKSYPMVVELYGQSETHPIKRNHYRTETRPQFSYFHYGLELIRDSVLHLSTKWRLFNQILQQLYYQPPMQSTTSGALC